MKAREIRARLVDFTAKGLCWLVAGATLAALGLIVGYVALRGIPSIVSEGPSYFTTGPHGIKMQGGVYPMIVSSVYLTALALAIAFPIGVGAAVYLAEYAGNGRAVRAIRYSADVLSGVPSIVFGLFGLTFFVYFLQMGYSILAGALTVVLMILPTLMRTSEEALRSVLKSYREASLSLGATKWQTVRKVVLPTAAPGIATGVILGMGRVFGETAAILYTAGTAPVTPILPLEGGRTLTIHLYLLATQGQIDDAFRVAALLLLVILAFNLMAGWVTAGFQRRYGGALRG